MCLLSFYYYRPNCLYPTLPKCSFTLKAKIRPLKQTIASTNTLGDYIRKERLKRGIEQQDLAKQFNINSVALSQWELNRKPPHPKYFTQIIEFLGFTPVLKSDFDRLGIRTKLYKIQRNISLKEFVKEINISRELLYKIEESRHCKLEAKVKRRIEQYITTSSEVLS
ncbi:MAG: helix-turn-helix domain-containing protein [Polaribacter sp.]